MNRAKREALNRERLLNDALAIQHKAHDGAKNCGVDWRAVREHRTDQKVMACAKAAIDESPHREPEGLRCWVKMGRGLVRVR